MAAIKVRFKGIADVRVLSRDDLKKHGITVKDDLIWNRRNLWALTLEHTDKLEELLRREGHFTISKVKDDKSEAVEAKAENPNKEGDTLKDGNTGATTKSKQGSKS